MLIILLLLSFSTNSVEKVIIPENSFRFRIIANSNSVEDQNDKIKIRNILTNNFASNNSKITSKEEAMILISSQISNINELVDSNYSKNYRISLGKNYFPEKEYNDVIYKDGYYDSLVVTLGDGLGDNWWCVLFPPLCMLDVEENEDKENVDYHFFIFDFIKDLFS